MLSSSVLRSLLACLLMAGVGCSASKPSALPSTQPSFDGLNYPKAVNSVEARCPVPLGWEADPIKLDGQHAHQVWISPSGKTAYGVIRFVLPFPVAPKWIVPFFLEEMRHSEGQAALIEKHEDEALPGIRFIAEGGQYKVRTNLLTRGWRGWAIYAGTLRAETIDAGELQLAERARERTLIELP